MRPKGTQGRSGPARNAFPAGEAGDELSLGEVNEGGSCDEGPEFLACIGDLLPGSCIPRKQLTRQWVEIL